MCYLYILLCHKKDHLRKISVGIDWEIDFSL